MKESGYLGRRGFPAHGRARDQSSFRDVGRHGEAHPAERLNPFRDGVHETALFFKVFVEKEMEGVERGPGDLPVVLFVEVAQRHGIGKELVQILDAFRACRLLQRDRHLDNVAVGLNLMPLLALQGSGVLEDLVRIEGLGHGCRASFSVGGLG